MGCMSRAARRRTQPWCTPFANDWLSSAAIASRLTAAAAELGALALPLLQQRMLARLSRKLEAPAGMPSLREQRPAAARS